MIFLLTPIEEIPIFRDEYHGIMGYHSTSFRLRRAAMGIHHRISGGYLYQYANYQYANEMAWREDNRRVANGTQWRWVTSAASRHPKSEIWRGYWQRSAA